MPVPSSAMTQTALSTPLQRCHTEFGVKAEITVHAPIQRKNCWWRLWGWHTSHIWLRACFRLDLWSPSCELMSGQLMKIKEELHLIGKKRGATISAHQVKWKNCSAIGKHTTACKAEAGLQQDGHPNQAKLEKVQDKLSSLEEKITVSQNQNEDSQTATRF